MKILDESAISLLSRKAIDELYEYYEVRHSFTMCLYLRFNGDAEFPGELLSKEEFPAEIYKSDELSYAYEALLQYMVKQYKIENNDLDN
jgi:hypothetical protein